MDMIHLSDASEGCLAVPELWTCVHFRDAEKVDDDMLFYVLDYLYFHDLCKHVRQVWLDNTIIGFNVDEDGYYSPNPDLNESAIFSVLQSLPNLEHLSVRGCRYVDLAQFPRIFATLHKRNKRVSRSLTSTPPSTPSTPLSALSSATFRFPSPIPYTRILLPHFRSLYIHGAGYTYSHDLLTLLQASVRLLQPANAPPITLDILPCLNCSTGVQLEWFCGKCCECFTACSEQECRQSTCDTCAIDTCTRCRGQCHDQIEPICECSAPASGACTRCDSPACDACLLMCIVCGQEVCNACTYGLPMCAPCTTKCTLCRIPISRSLKGKGVGKATKCSHCKYPYCTDCIQARCACGVQWCGYGCFNVATVEGHAHCCP